MSRTDAHAERDSRSRVLLPYAFGLVLAVISFLVTRGRDGRFILFLGAFTVAGVVYAVLVVRSSAWPATRHSLGHLVWFEFLCLGAARLDTHLEALAGMLPGLVGAGVLVIVATGAIALFSARVWGPHFQEERAAGGPRAGAAFEASSMISDRRRW